MWACPFTSFCSVTQTLPTIKPEASPCLALPHICRPRKIPKSWQVVPGWHSLTPALAVQPVFKPDLAPPHPASVHLHLLVSRMLLPSLSGWTTRKISIPYSNVLAFRKVFCPSYRNLHSLPQITVLSALRGPGRI